MDNVHLSIAQRRQPPYPAALKPLAECHRWRGAAHGHAVSCCFPYGECGKTGETVRMPCLAHKTARHVETRRQGRLCGRHSLLVGQLDMFKRDGMTKAAVANNCRRRPKQLKRIIT
eukprot:350458-Chlamydomonas_euryale.AAC.2